MHNFIMSAIKHDADKPLVGLLSSKWLIEVSKVLTFGAKKYGDHNWRKGMKASRLFNAMQRHLLAWNDGQDNDDESGLCHLDHAACCLMMLRELMITHPIETDDRHKEESKQS